MLLGIDVARMDVVLSEAGDCRVTEINCSSLIRYLNELCKGWNLKRLSHSSENGGVSGGGESGRLIRWILFLMLLSAVSVFAVLAAKLLSA